MIEHDESMSPQEFRSRREQILMLALDAARRRRRRRRTVTRGAIAATALVVATLAGLMSRIQRSPKPGQPLDAIVITEPAGPTRVIVEHFHTDPTIISRLALKPRSPRWQTIGDDELLMSLASAGRESGLIQVDGRALLIQRTVTVR
jgi:hypothetical protein